MSDTVEDPIDLFKQWLSDASSEEPENPNAMALATADKNGSPSVRMVLMKDVDERGFVFYTNLSSRKGQELKENPCAALMFYWKSLARQIRIEGTIQVVSETEADDYFRSRPKLSQIGAWASKQSDPLEDRFALEKRVTKYLTKFKFGSIPRPEFWNGFRLAPTRIEFWREEAFRLHDRTLYIWADNSWAVKKLYP